MHLELMLACRSKELGCRAENVTMARKSGFLASDGKVRMPTRLVEAGELR